MAKQLPHAWAVSTISHPAPRAMCRAALAALVAMGVGGIAGSAWAQPKPQDKDEIAEPVTSSVDTKDGVKVRITYYPGKQDKKTVPIILLHAWGGQGSDLDVLASSLQKRGHAVIVPDLRGHGGSKTQQLPGGDPKTIDPERFRAADFGGFVLDVEAVKKYLIERHNAGELNIELLCVVGVEFGSVVAMNWAVTDWSWPQLPGYKQGQDVQAYVLVSPEQAFKSFSMQPALNHNIVQKNLSGAIIVGKQDAKKNSTAGRIYSTLKRFHPTAQDDHRGENQDLFLFALPTSLQGNKLIEAKGMNVEPIIAQFIKLRIEDRRDEFPWKERKSPLRN